MKVCMSAIVVLAQLAGSGTVAPFVSPIIIAKIKVILTILK